MKTKAANSEKRFGWAAELEVMLVRRDGLALREADINWRWLNDLLNSLDEPNPELFAAKYPEHLANSFYIEGFDELQDDRTTGMLVKGIEIRTPVCATIPQFLAVTRDLCERAQSAFEQYDMTLGFIGCNPFGKPFSGAQGNRTFDDWRAAEVTMSTAGLHANLSVPPEIEDQLLIPALERRLDYYAPAMALLSSNSPFMYGNLWQVSGKKIGKSSRTFLRSFYRRPLTRKPGAYGTRFHFSLFDMCNDLDRAAAALELCMGMLLNEYVTAPPVNDAIRRFNLVQVAEHGFNAALFDGHTQSIAVVQLCADAIDIAREGLSRAGITPVALQHLDRTLACRQLPADLLIERALSGTSLQEIMREDAALKAAEPEETPALQAAG